MRNKGRDENWSKETCKTDMGLTKKIKELSERLEKAVDYSFSQNQEIWRLRKQVKYFQNRIKGCV